VPEVVSRFPLAHLLELSGLAEPSPHSLRSCRFDARRSRSSLQSSESRIWFDSLSLHFGTSIEFPVNRLAQHDFERSPTFRTRRHFRRSLHLKDYLMGCFHHLHRRPFASDCWRIAHSAPRSSTRLSKTTSQYHSCRYEETTISLLQSTYSPTVSRYWCRLGTSLLETCR